MSCLRNIKIYIKIYIKTAPTSLGVSSPLCILELSRLTRVEKAAKNTTIVVIYKVLVYIQISQPTDEIFVYTQTPCILQL